MSIPAADLAVPARVRALARGAAVSPVWINGVGGVTCRTSDDRYIKVGPLHHETSMAAEADRLRWAAPHTAVPDVLEVGDDGAEEWLVTRALAGLSAVGPRWIAEPATAVRAIGEGLRALHEALPVAGCPFDWSVPTRIANAAAGGIHVPDALRSPPPVDVLVVCHGDACAPNTLLDADGRVLAHVDLGALGVADRWADIAVAAMSTTWNYGPGWERLAYYRDLWNAT